MEERFLLTDIPMSDGWLIPSALQIKGDFSTFNHLVEPLTLRVIVCHHVAYNALFYSRINACNFATDKETDRCNRWKSN